MWLRVPSNPTLLTSAFRAKPPTAVDSTLINLTMEEKCLVRPHVLCRHCQEFCSRADVLHIPPKEWIERRDQIPDQEFEHCPNISELEKTASSGCHLCVLLWNSIRKETLREIIASSAARGRPVSLKLWGPQRGTKMAVYQMKLTLQFRGSSSYPASSERDLWIQHKAQIPFDEDSNFHDAQLSLSTGSPGILRLARHWLARCEGNHTACCTSTTHPSALPTRLIDVEMRTTSDVRLYVVDQNDAGIRYLTLSHCWGGSAVLTLKAGNMSQLIAGFHMKDLPKTFEDAVEITRRLGFRYLWIDAICIIQDSAADWEREASRMASVYENSTCTIGALSGANSHAGCFKSRQPLEHFSCRVGQEGSNAVFITSKHVFWELINENGTGPGQPGPLNTRAWVVQERMMSPRTLYFGSRRIHWECRTNGSPDHDIETDFDANDHASLLKSAFDILRAPLHPLVRPGHRYTFYAGWKTFMTQYSAGRLTRPEDRLVALTGIVDVVRRCMGLSMVSGLWVELLPFEILWTRDFYRDDSHLIPPPQYKRAPSWSWASQDGPIHVADVSFAKTPTFFIDDIEFEDPSSQVNNREIARSENCVLHISGPLVHIENHVIIHWDNDFYTLCRNFKAGNIEDFKAGNVEDQCFVVFDLDQPDTVRELSSPQVQLFCLLVSRSSPIPMNCFHGVQRILEVLEMDRLFYFDERETEKEEKGEDTRSGHDSDDNGNDKNRDDKEVGNNDLFAGGNEGGDCDDEIEEHEDERDDYGDVEEGYEYNEHSICDHGLVLHATGLGGRYRRVGVFRSYLHKRGQTLFESIPPMAKIAIE